MTWEESKDAVHKMEIDRLKMYEDMLTEGCEKAAKTPGEPTYIGAWLREECAHHDR